MNTYNRSKPYLPFLALLLSLTMILTSCTGQATSTEIATEEVLATPDEEATEPTVEEATEPISEEPQTLTIASDMGFMSLDPAVDCGSAGSVLTAVYDQLVQKRPKPGPSGSMNADPADFQPKLATSWQVSPDATEYTFTLRKGVKFSNGHDLNAEAVKYSLERVITMGMCGSYPLTGGLAGNIESIEAPNDETVVVHLAKGDPLFLEALSLYNASIVDPAIVEENGGVVQGEVNEYMASNAIGSGPFTIASYDPSVEIVLEANPDYWGGKPPIDRLVIMVVADVSTRELLLRSGSIDMALAVPFKDLGRLQEEGLTVLQFTKPWYAYIGLNYEDPILTNINVRKAILYAVPYAEIISDTIYGYGSPLEGPLPSTMPYFCESADYPYTYDLEKAKEFMEASGYETVDFELSVVASQTEYVGIATIVQDTLKQIGVNLTINKVSPAEFYDRLTKFEMQMFVADNAPWINDPAYLLGYSIPCGDPGNRTQYCNPQVDEWMIEARHETDKSKRQELYCQISQQFIDDAPMVMLFQRDEAPVMAPYVTGLIFDPAGYYDFSRASTQ